MRSLLLALLLATPAVATPSAETVLADLRRMAQSAEPHSFERTTVTELPDSRIARVDRLEMGPDGKPRWRLISVNGKSPTEADIKAHRKDVEAQPIPGFHRLDRLLEGQPSEVVQQGSEIRFRWDRLSKGALGMNGPDFSNRLSGEALVTVTDEEPQLKQVRIYAKEPFSIMVMAKMHSFDAVSDYRPGPDRLPFLTAQKTHVHVNIPFKGEQDTRATVSFRPL